MSFQTFEILRACRRSRIKVRVLHALFVNKQLLLTELADIANTSPTRVLGAIEGDGEEFAFDNALSRLGAVRARRTPRGNVYEITSEGRYAWRKIRVRLPRGSLKADAR